MSAIPETPATLIARMAAQISGEDEANWARFVSLYQPVILKFAEYAGIHADAEDVAQNVLVKLVDILRNGTYQPEKGRFRAYLATLTRRVAINQWHKDKVREGNGKIPLDGDDQPMEISVPPETLAVLDVKWRLARHTAAVEHVLTKTALSQQSKSVYRAYVIEEKPIGEVAKAFGIPRNSVSQIKTRVERMIADFEAMLSD